MDAANIWLDRTQCDDTMLNLHGIVDSVAKRHPYGMLCENSMTTVKSIMWVMYSNIWIKDRNVVFLVHGIHTISKSVSLV